MNFIGHAVVAHEMAYASPLVTFGAMVPDLKRTISFSPRALDNPSIARGLAHHHLCDHAFHSHPMFINGSRDLRDHALEAGLRRGQARVVGHLGWELLFDETLRATTDANAIVATALRTGADELDLTCDSDDASCIELRWIAERATTTPPSSPRLLAQRLAHFTEGRPRVAIETDLIDTVASLLESAAGFVARASVDVLCDVVSACTVAAAHER